MAVSSKQGDDDVMAEINITPFTDVLLVLLIIFMISATAIVQAGFNIKLPKAQSKEQPNPSPITVNVEASGRIHVGKDEVPADTLKEYLRKLNNREGSDRVVIIADESVKYGVVIQVMDDAKAAGLTSVALAAQRQ